MTTEPADYYRVGNHQPQNIYRGDTYIGVMFDPAYAAAVVDALNTTAGAAAITEPGAVVGSSCPACGSHTPSSRKGRWDGGVATFCDNPWHDAVPPRPNPDQYAGLPVLDPAILAPDQCPNCTSGRRDLRYVVSVMDGTTYIADEDCPDGWHDR